MNVLGLWRGAVIDVEKPSVRSSIARQAMRKKCNGRRMPSSRHERVMLLSLSMCVERFNLADQ